MKALPLILVLMAGFSLHAQAEKYYKWVDSEGVTHYTTSPPEEAPASTVNVKTGRTQSESTADGGGEDTGGQAANESQPQGKTAEELAREAKAAEEELAQEQARQAELNRKNCAIARKNAFNLKHRDRIRVADEETGEQRYLTPTELQQWRTRTQQQIQEFCDPSTASAAGGQAINP